MMGGGGSQFGVRSGRGSMKDGRHQEIKKRKESQQDRIDRGFWR